MTNTDPRPKDCIICGGATGSREHVFPSALGGRREDKKIYCSDHNQWMGPHVSVLQAQLAAINAMLEVQPDRGDVRSYVFDAVDGGRYAIRGADISPAPDFDVILDGYELGKPRDLTMAPSDIPKLRARAKERGLTLDILEKAAPSVAFRAGGYTVPLMQGGDDAMRAVAYLALTFVAHFWPHLARAPGLKPVKDMLRGGPVYRGADRLVDTVPARGFVAWSPALVAPPELVHPTGLGHTIVLCVHAGQVLAYVSLLDLQCWTIRLGEAVPELTDRTVVVHVDPLKTRYGDDWVIQVFDRALIDGCVDPEYLGQAVLESDRMQRQISTVMQRVIDRRDRLEAEQARSELNAALCLPSPAREAAIYAFVAQRGQRLVNLICMFAEHGDPTTPIGALVHAGAVKATRPDQSSTDGLNDAARRVLDQVVTQLCETLVKAPAGYTLDCVRYLALFRDEVGQALIASALAQESLR